MQLFDTNYVIAAEPIDPAFVGTLQEYFDHCVARMSIKSPTAPYNVIVSDSKPQSNQGLLLLGGTKVYVWDEDQSAYVPANITDSLFAPGTGKAVFTVDDGNFIWKTPSDFVSWLNFGIGSLTTGAAGTIAYSNGTINAWGTPEVALVAKSISIAKLKSEAADAGKFAQAQADGTVLWSTTGSARGQVAVTAEATVPADAASVEITRPDGAVALDICLVAKASPLFTGISGSTAPGDYGYVVGEELSIFSPDTGVGDGARITAFDVIKQSAKWIIHRRHDFSGAGGVQVGNRLTPTGTPVDLNLGNWKIIIRYL